MTMPQIPEEKHRPSLEETVIDLLESIALEEMAISHLINAEAEKNQALICKFFNDDKCRLHELVKYNKTTCKIIDSVIIKEWLLLKKLEMTLEIGVLTNHKEHNPDCTNSQNCLCTCCDCENNSYLTCKASQSGNTCVK